MTDSADSNASIKNPEYQQKPVKVETDHVQFPPGPQPVVQSSVLFAQQMHSGPLPPPDILERYDHAHPGTAAIIVQMAQDGHAAEIERARKAQSDVYKLDLSGRAFGFIFALICALGGMILVALGHDTAGATIAGGAITGTVVALIRGHGGKS